MLFVIIPPVGYLAIWSSGLGLIGYAILKAIIELTNFIGLIYILKTYCSPECSKQESFSNIFVWPEIKEYLISLWPIFYGWYSSYICFELVIVMVGYTRDTDL
jgi:Na+-driven multidrug efflux pump